MSTAIRPSSIAKYSLAFTDQWIKIDTNVRTLKTGSVIDSLRNACVTRRLAA